MSAPASCSSNNDTKNSNKSATAILAKDIGENSMKINDVNSNTQLSILTNSKSINEMNDSVPAMQRQTLSIHHQQQQFSCRDNEIYEPNEKRLFPFEHELKDEYNAKQKNIEWNELLCYLRQQNTELKSIILNCKTARDDHKLLIFPFENIIKTANEKQFPCHIMDNLSEATAEKQCNYCLMKEIYLFPSTSKQPKGINFPFENDLFIKENLQIRLQQLRERIKLQKIPSLSEKRFIAIALDRASKQSKDFEQFPFENTLKIDPKQKLFPYTLDLNKMHELKFDESTISAHRSKDLKPYLLQNCKDNKFPLISLKKQNFLDYKSILNLDLIKPIKSLKELQKFYEENKIEKSLTTTRNSVAMQTTPQVVPGAKFPFEHPLRCNKFSKKFPNFKQIEKYSAASRTTTTNQEQHSLDSLRKNISLDKLSAATEQPTSTAIKNTKISKKSMTHRRQNLQTKKNCQNIFNNENKHHALSQVHVESMAEATLPTTSLADHDEKPNESNKNSNNNYTQVNILPAKIDSKNTRFYSSSSPTAAATAALAHNELINNSIFGKTCENEEKQLPGVMLSAIENMKNISKGDIEPDEQPAASFAIDTLYEHNDDANARFACTTPPMSSSTTSVLPIQRISEMVKILKECHDDAGAAAAAYEAASHEQFDNFVECFSDVRDTLIITVDSQKIGGTITNTNVSTGSFLVKQFSASSSYQQQQQQSPVPTDFHGDHNIWTTRQQSQEQQQKQHHSQDKINENNNLNNFSFNCELLPKYYLLELLYESNDRNYPEIKQQIENIINQKADSALQQQTSLNFFEQLQQEAQRTGDLQANEMTVVRSNEDDESIEKTEVLSNSQINILNNNEDNDGVVDEMKYEMKNVKGASAIGNSATMSRNSLAAGGGGVGGSSSKYDSAYSSRSIPIANRSNSSSHDIAPVSSTSLRNSYDRPSAMTNAQHNRLSMPSLSAGATLKNYHDGALASATNVEHNKISSLPSRNYGESLATAVNNTNLNRMPLAAASSIANTSRLPSTAMRNYAAESSTKNLGHNNSAIPIASIAANRRSSNDMSAASSIANTAMLPSAALRNYAAEGNTKSLSHNNSSIPTANRRNSNDMSAAGYVYRPPASITSNKTAGHIHHSLLPISTGTRQNSTEDINSNSSARKPLTAISLDIPLTSSAALQSQNIETASSTDARPASFDTSSSLDAVLPERTRLRRQRRLRNQDSQEQPEDVIERLNRLKASISATLNEVKGVLKTYSMDEGEEDKQNEFQSNVAARVAAARSYNTGRAAAEDYKSKAEPQLGTDTAEMEEAAAAANEADGPISFRFVKKVRRRSVFKDEDEDNEKEKQKNLQEAGAKEEKPTSLEINEIKANSSKDEVDKGMQKTLEIIPEIARETDISELRKPDKPIDLDAIGADNLKANDNVNFRKSPLREITAESGNKAVANKDQSNHVADKAKQENKAELRTQDKALEQNSGEQETKAEFSKVPALVKNEENNHVADKAKQENKSELPGHSMSKEQKSEQKETKAEGQSMVLEQKPVKEETKEAVTAANAKIDDSKESLLLAQDISMAEANKQMEAAGSRQLTNEQNPLEFSSQHVKQKAEEEKVEACSLAPEPLTTKTGKKKHVTKTKESNTASLRRASLAAVEPSKIEPPIKTGIPMAKIHRRPSDSEAIIKKKPITTKITSGIAEEVTTTTPKTKIIKVRRNSIKKSEGNKLNADNNQLPAVATISSAVSQTDQELPPTTLANKTDLQQKTGKNKDAPPMSKAIEQIQIISSQTKNILPTQKSTAAAEINEQTSLNKQSIKENSLINDRATIDSTTTNLAANKESGGGVAMPANIAIPTVSSLKDSEPIAQTKVKNRQQSSDDVHDLLRAEAGIVLVVPSSKLVTIGDTSIGNRALSIKDDSKSSSSSSILVNQAAKETIQKEPQQLLDGKAQVEEKQSTEIPIDFHKQNCQPSQNQQQQQQQLASTLATPPTTTELVVAKNDIVSGQIITSSKQPSPTRATSSSSSITSYDDKLLTKADEQQLTSSNIIATTKDISSPQISISRQENLKADTSSNNKSIATNQTQNLKYTEDKTLTQPEQCTAEAEENLKEQHNMPELQLTPAPVQTATDTPKKKIIIKKIVRQTSIDKAKQKIKSADKELTAEAASEPLSTACTENELQLKQTSDEESSVITDAESSESTTATLDTTDESNAATAAAAAVPAKKERKVKRKVIIRRQKRRLSIGDSFFHHAASTEEEPANTEIETLEKAISYVTDDDDDDSEKQQDNSKTDDTISEEQQQEPAEEKKPLKSCLLIKEYHIGDEVLYAERFKKTQIRWKRGRVKERITSISYLIEIDGKDVSSHINYLKKYTGRKVNFGGKEYLEIDYEQLAEEEEKAEKLKQRTRSIWNMV